MSMPEQWAQAYGRQARADFELFARLLGTDEVCQCHRLQLLQMACEKLCKAHLCKSGSEPEKLQQSHAYIARNLPIILRQYLARRARGLRSHLMRHYRHLAREIELLAPSVDDAGRRLDNCEYPWEVAPDAIRTPSEHQFANLNLLTTPDGRSFLKYLEHAVARTA